METVGRLGLCPLFELPELGLETVGRFGLCPGCVGLCVFPLPGLPALVPIVGLLGLLSPLLGILSAKVGISLAKTPPRSGAYDVSVSPPAAGLFDGNSPAGCSDGLGATLSSLNCGSETCLQMSGSFIVDKS